MSVRPAQRRRRDLLIVGAGSHAQVVAEAATAAGWRVVAFVDENPEAPELNGIRVAHRGEIFGSYGRRPSRKLPPCIAAIGDNEARQRVQHLLIDSCVPLANVVHPAAWVSPSAALGAGVFIGAHAVVNTGARLGAGVIVNSGALVEHHNQIGAFAHIAPHAALAGSVNIGALTLIGIGACVRQGITVGERCVVGAGAAVVKNVGDCWTVVGVPAKRRLGK